MNSNRSASQVKRDGSNSRRSDVPVVGLIGPIGAGKSAVASLFGEWGAAVISADQIGHNVIQDSEPLQRQLIRAFGDEIISKGRIDRSLLAERAFIDRTTTERLNSLVHPPLIREVNRQVRNARRRREIEMVVIDAALLLEWGEGRIQWDVLVGVWAPERLRLPRWRRRGLAAEDFHRRSRQQMAWTRKRRRCACVVKNDETLSKLRHRARLCWGKLLLFRA